MSVSDPSRNIIRKLAVVGLMGLAVAMVPLEASACSSNFGCGIGKRAQCWFKIFSKTGIKTIVVPEGKARKVRGVQEGDVYCTDNRGMPNSGDCKKMPVIKITCP